MWQMTMDMMDAAAYYYQKTGKTELRFETGNPALRLDVAIGRVYGKVSLKVREAIARETIAKVKSLL